MIFLVPKIASSSLARVFIPYIQNTTYDQSIFALHKTLWSRAGRLTDINKFENTTSFVITRHPFTRIVSAYRNKFQADTRIEEQFIIRYGRDIAVAARREWNEGDPDPSFAEFVRYLIKTEVEQYDEHWQLISLRCRYGSKNSLSLIFWSQTQSKQAIAVTVLGCIPPPPPPPPPH